MLIMAVWEFTELKKLDRPTQLGGLFHSIGTLFWTFLLVQSLGMGTGELMHEGR